jgi:2-keto-4-pentenoate hydratase/2-oxohepta-3-ene-1,7-dioic acid hydratase in catechol pathway
MIFDIPSIISYVSRFIKVQTGDYIFSGTPVGVGPVKVGDVLTGYIEDRELLQCEIR